MTNVKDSKDIRSINLQRHLSGWKSSTQVGLKDGKSLIKAATLMVSRQVKKSRIYFFKVLAFWLWLEKTVFEVSWEENNHKSRFSKVFKGESVFSEGEIYLTAFLSSSSIDEKVLCIRCKICSVNGVYEWTAVNQSIKSSVANGSYKVRSKRYSNFSVYMSLYFTVMVLQNHHITQTLQKQTSLIMTKYFTEQRQDWKL